MASFMLIAGAAFAGVAVSNSFGRRRKGDLVTECVRGRSEEDWDGFALEDIVRGRAAGDFGTRGVEGEGAGREGLMAADGWSRVVVRREPELVRETGKRDFDGLGRFERPGPVPVEVAIELKRP